MACSSSTETDNISPIINARGNYCRPIAHRERENKDWT
jgi:hypothetical protein